MTPPSIADVLSRAVSCVECKGEGCVEHPFLTGSTSIVAESPPDPALVDCEHCRGTGECECDECVSAASEAAWERESEDFHGGPGPLSLDEQHQRAWQQKQELRR
jgi:DnaJ-class molecular chaperone